tara:strand:- start:43 stop:1605 length:1563 start_codon:yes stop_codon:yes gene_type:complete
MPIFLVTVDGKTLNINAVSRGALQNKYPGAYVNPIPRPESRVDPNQLADLRGSSLFFPRVTGRRDEITLDQAYQQQASGLPVSPTPSESIGGRWRGIASGIGGLGADAYRGVQMGDVFGEGQPPGVPPTPQDRTLELAAQKPGSSTKQTLQDYNSEGAFSVSQGRQAQAQSTQAYEAERLAAQNAASGGRAFGGGRAEIDPNTGRPYGTAAPPPAIDRSVVAPPSVAPPVVNPQVTSLRGLAELKNRSQYEIDPSGSGQNKWVNPFEPIVTTVPPVEPVLPVEPIVPGGIVGTGLTYEEQRQKQSKDQQQMVEAAAAAAAAAAPMGQTGQSELSGMGLPSLEEQSLGGVYTQYLQDQGAARGVNPLVSNYARGQGQTAEQLFGAAQRIGGGNPLVSEASQFRDFLSRTPNYGTQSLVGTAMGDISRTVGQGMMPGSEEFYRFNPENVSEGSDLANLARAASQRNVSPFIRRDFYQRPGLTNSQLFDTFAANRDRGNAQGFADYLGQSFGLRNFGSQLGLV